MTLTPIAERLAVEQSLPFLRLRSLAAGTRIPNPPHARGERSNRLHHRRGLRLKVMVLNRPSFADLYCDESGEQTA